jgi:hypothetical protein
MHVVELDGVARFVFGADGPEVWATPAPAAGRELIEEYFRRWILPVAVQAGGLEVLHASAVVAQKGVVAFSAPSEAGKSTLAYGLTTRGYPLWTDDALAFDVVDGKAEAFPLPFRLRLRAASAEHFGLEPRPAGTIAAESDGQLGEPREIVALFLLERVSEGPHASLAPVGALEAFPLLVEGSYHFGEEQGERKRALLSRYLELAGTVPIHRLTMSSGLGNLDRILDLVEERL